MSLSPYSNRKLVNASNTTVNTSNCRSVVLLFLNKYYGQSDMNLKCKQLQNLRSFLKITFVLK